MKSGWWLCGAASLALHALAALGLWRLGQPVPLHSPSAAHAGPAVGEARGEAIRVYWVEPTALARGGHEAPGEHADADAHHHGNGAQVPSGAQGASASGLRPGQQAGGDKAAELVGDWAVDAQQWPMEVRSVQVRLWISATGEVERWTILGDAAHDPRIMASFENMGNTLMNPALSGGVAVASTMMIEIFSDR